MNIASTVVGRFLQLAYVTSMVHALLAYVENSLFDPGDVGCQAWPSKYSSHEMEGLGGNWYNPGIAVLSAKLRSQLSAETARDVHYLMSFRRNLNLGSCMSLYNPKHRNKPYNGHMTAEELAEFGTGITDDRMPPSFVLVDAAKKPILPPLGLTGDAQALRWLNNTDDVRLEVGAKFAFNKVLGHGNSRHSRDTWFNNIYAFFWLEVFNSTTLKVSMFEHGQIRANPWKNRERIQNIGVLWDGDPQENFRLIWWLDSTVDVRIGLPPKLHQINGGPNSTGGLTNGLDGAYRKPLHGNGSPIALDDWYPGLAIAAAHAWLDAGADSMHRGRHYNSTRWHNTYVTNFVIFKNKPPYETVAISPPFCFPSVSRRSSAKRPLCDVIQFVTGFVRVLESDFALLTYGINDCESAVIEIPILDIVRFTSPELAFRIRRASPRFHALA